MVENAATERANRDVLIAVPGRQHADQLALALAEAGWRPALHHGAPIRPALTRALAACSHPHRLTGLVFRAGNRLLPLPQAYALAERMYARFDRSVARRVSPTTRLVIGYESGSLALFRAARTLGIPTILDAASVHHRLQASSGLADAGTAFRAAVDARKDAEIALADHILCCSRLAAQSYIDAGVPADRVHAVPLGFDAGSFAPERAAPHDGRLRIAFVGRFSHVKGADLLAAALERLAACDMPVACRIAASTGSADGEAAIVARLARHAELLGKVPHDSLAELYHWADLLVMPSRFDSFGLVVLEALACGLPVLASDHVGAADVIVPGVNGEVIRFNDVAALTGALMRHAADPAVVRAMRPAAAASAQGAEWPRYRERVAAVIAGILDRADRA